MSTPAAEQADIGILFVHGIGTQRRGWTLSEFGGPVYDWIRRWIGKVHRGRSAAGVTTAGVGEWAKERLDPTWEQAPPEVKARRLAVLRQMILEVLPTTKTSVRPDAARAGFDEVVAAGVTLRDARVRPEDAESGAPSRVTVDLTAIHGSGEVEEGSWLMAESWWAESFAPPPLSRLFLWTGQVVPWVIGSHFGAHVRRAALEFRRAAEPHPPEAPSKTVPREAAPWGVAAAASSRRVLAALAALARFVAAVAYLLFGLALSPFVLMILGLLLVLALPPIPALRNFVAGVQRALAATLGDSYVLLANPIEGAAIISRVARDMAWLSARCQRLAVVAHSQGAAVACLALQREVPGNLRLLLTLGSGLRKLDELRQFGNPRSHQRKLAGMVTISLSLVVFLSLALTRPGADTGWIAIADAFWVAIFLLCVLVLVLGQPTIELDWMASSLRDAGLRWEDHFATADPVPNGPLFDQGVVEAAPIPVTVHNRGSLVGDHTAYWTNVDEFVGGVVLALVRVGDGKFGRLFAGAAEAVRQGSDWRAFRVAMLGWARKVALAVGVLLGISARHEWRAVFAWAAGGAWARLSSLVPGGLGPPAAAVALPPDVRWPTFGALASLGLAYAVVHVAWLYWDHAETMAFFDEVDRDGTHWPFGLFATSVGLMSLGGYSFRYVAPAVPGLRSVFALGMWVLVATVLMGGVREMLRTRAHRDARSPVPASGPPRS